MSKLSMDSTPERPHGRPHSPTILQEIEEEIINPNEIVTDAPKGQFRLGYLDVTCLVFNHVMGTGIFNSPGRVIAGTNSTGAALLCWFAGIVSGLCGAHVYVEYGLNVPRYTIDGVEQTVPRSGGDLHYLHYVYRKPRYKKDTILFFPCLYGIAFICLGNMAGNSVTFAVRVLQASHPGSSPEDFSGAAVRGIAIAVATATCFIHTVSRRGGIFLNNLLAIVKVGILLLIIITAIVVSAGGFKDGETGKEVSSVTAENLDAGSAFDPISKDVSEEANGFAQAFLAIVFAFSGFNQTNYVLGEIRRPRKTFPISMVVAASILATLYMAVNICYMVVVPKEEQIRGNLAQTFFRRTYGALGDDRTGERVFNTFLAISSLGNIIVMTFTAARMKQEIAKEGILPFARFFAQDYDLSLGRLLHWLRARGMFTSVLRQKWLRPEAHSEKTPVGAFLLHFISCIILILATSGLNPDDAYNILTSAWVYLFPAFFGFLLSLGILILRFRPPKSLVSDPDAPGGHPCRRTWTEMTNHSVNPILSVVCAVIYCLGCAYPVIVSWIPPSEDLEEGSVGWFVIPTIACGVLGFAALWFLGFLAYAKRREYRRHQKFVIERYPEFEWAEGEGSTREQGVEEDESYVRRKAGGLVLVHETVSLLWKGRDTLELGRMMAEASRVDGIHGTNGANGASGIDGVNRVTGAKVGAVQAQRSGMSNPFAGTDFEELGR